MRKVFSCIIFIFLCGTILSAEAGEVTVVGYGTSYQAALDDVFRNAVEKAVGVLVEANTLVKNYEVVHDQIYTQSKGFIQDYTILKEEKKNGQFLITARVLVKTEPDSALYNILQRMKLIGSILKNPRIAVVIRECNISQPVNNSMAETAIIAQLKKAGFDRVLETKKLLGKESNNSDKFVAMFARKKGLDYLMIGEAESKLIGRVLNSSLISCRAIMEAKFMKADTGQIIAAKSFEASAVDIDKEIAGQKALYEIGEQMGLYMTTEILNNASAVQEEIILLFKGILGFEQVNELEKELIRISGMRGVYIRNYDAGNANIELDYNGSMSSLIEELINLGLKIKQKTANTVTVTKE